MISILKRFFFALRIRSQTVCPKYRELKFKRPLQLDNRLKRLDAGGTEGNRYVSKRLKHFKVTLFFIDHSRNDTRHLRAIFPGACCHLLEVFLRRLEGNGRSRRI